MEFLIVLFVALLLLYHLMEAVVTGLAWGAVIGITCSVIWWSIRRYTWETPYGKTGIIDK